jgi:hypothetical protein
MSTSRQFNPPRAIKFPEEMLVQLVLGSPKDLVEDYGYTYDDIKDLPHFQVQLQRVETELFNEGAITKVIAGAGLHQVVESVARRVLDPRMPTADLIKSGEFLKKVKDDGKDPNQGPAKPQFSIEINFPDGSKTTIKDVRPVEEDVPALEIDEDPLPPALIEAYEESEFGVDIE